MCNLQVLTKEFEGQEVAFRNNDTTGQTEVRINEVARFCGWTRIANSGNEVIRWTTVNKFLKELSCQQVGTGDFIPEYIMYPLIGKANNEKATQFMLWVGKILVDLRVKGIVILDNAKDETIEFEKKFGKYRIRKTFANSTDVIGDYKQFINLSKEEWKAKRLNNINRVKLSNIVISAIEDKINSNVLEMKASEILQLQELISDIKTDVIKLSNKKNGGDKTAQTKEIKKLQEQIENISIYPRESEFITLDVHGFSNNYMYRYVDGGTYKTEAYKTWIKYFPVEQLPTIDYWETDFNEPIELFINYIAKADMDIRNFDKSFIDTVFHELGIDDNIVESVHSQKVGTVDSFDDGKISFYIRNI